MLLVLFAATLTGLGRLESLAKDGEISTTACYAALANDVTPLIDAAASDTAAQSPICDPQLELAADRTREANVNRTSIGKLIVVRLPLATVDASAGANASASTPSTEPMR